MQRTLQDAWKRRGALAWLLWPVSIVYGVVWRLRQWLYRVGLRTVHRLPVPVVVVGNVVAGGAGKTPVVIAVVEYLQAHGLRPGVVSRGYGRHTRDCRLVTQNALPGDVGDEPLLIHRRTAVPVAVAVARAEAGMALLQAHPDLDLLVCDDGLQHRALHSDVTICLFDERGIGNGLLLPAGPLREPWPRSVDLIVRSGQLPGATVSYRMHRTLADHAVRADGSRVALQSLVAAEGQTPPALLAVAGTAQPEAFFRMLRARGLHLSRTVALSDHADFDSTAWLPDGDSLVLCTEKDAVKLWLHRPDALAVPLCLDLEADFWRALDRLLLSRGTQQMRAKLSSPDGNTPTRLAGLPGHQGPARI